MPAPLYFVFGCFSATIAELSGGERHDVTHSLRYLLFGLFRNNLLTLGFEPYMSQLVVINPKGQ